MKNFTQKIITLFVTVFVMSSVLIAQSTHIISTSPYNIFYPAYLDVFPGDTIRFEYDGMSYPHTTTSTNIPLGAIPWDAELSFENSSFDIVLTVVGVYDYVCTPHIEMGMVGEITVLTDEVEHDIIGNWLVDSADMSIIAALDEETIEYIEMMAIFLTPEEFLEEFGFEMPTTDEEWAYLAENGIPFTMPNVEVGLYVISFSDNYMTFYTDDGPMMLSYEFTNDTTITILSPPEDFPFTEFNILNLSNTSLNLSSSGFIIDEDGVTEETTMVFYCSSIEELIFGCIDDLALNFNSDANIDDGSCEYPYLCASNELLLTMYDDEEDGWEGSQLVINGQEYSLDDGYMGVACINIADCYIFSTIEGDYMDEATWMLSNENEEVINEGGLPYNMNDVDNDLVCDELDNCSEVYNPDQLDTDNNQIGDACDYEDGLGIGETANDYINIVKMIDVLGQEHLVHKSGQILFYIYENGKVQKRLKH